MKKQDLIKKIDEQASALTNRAEQLDLLELYTDTVLKDEKRDPYAVQFFIKAGGLDCVYANITNIRHEIQAISDKLTGLSLELEEGGE